MTLCGLWQNTHRWITLCDFWCLFMSPTQTIQLIMLSEISDCETFAYGCGSSDSGILWQNTRFIELRTSRCPCQRVGIHVAPHRNVAMLMSATCLQFCLFKGDVVGGHGKYPLQCITHVVAENQLVDLLTLLHALKRSSWSTKTRYNHADNVRLRLLHAQGEASHSTKSEYTADEGC